MLALRSTLIIDATDEAGLRAAVRSAADAVVIDLAAVAAHDDRTRARALASRYARAIAATGRPVYARVSAPRTGELEADLDVVVAAGIAAVVLAGVEVPQDARDIDVATRKREMRGSLEPGGIRLIAEIDSAAGLAALARIIDAVDRHDAIALAADTLSLEFRGVAGGAAMIAHAMGVVSLAAHAARLPWILGSPDGDAALATRAHDFGAAGVTVRAEAAVRGMNALFDLDPAAVAEARAALAEWERLRHRDGWIGAVGDRLVDRRAVRGARALVARADAIAARERAT